MEVGFCDIELKHLIKAEWNYKTDDEDKAVKLRNNIEKNGLIENLIVRIVGKKFEVVNGNHRYDAISSLGHKTAHCYNLGKVSLEVAQRIALETNELKFENDELRLGKIIKALAEKFQLEDLSTTMDFSTKQLDNLAKLDSFDWDGMSVPARNPKERNETDHAHRFIITIQDDGDMGIQEDLLQICKKYPTAKMEVV